MLSMGKSTISMVTFHSYGDVYQRGRILGSTIHQPLGGSPEVARVARRCTCRRPGFTPWRGPIAMAMWSLGPSWANGAPFLEMVC